MGYLLARTAEHEGKLWALCEKLSHFLQSKHDYEHWESDMRDHRCSWLAIEALEHATRAQRQTLEAAYDDLDVQTVGTVYRELDLPRRRRGPARGRYGGVCPRLLRSGAADGVCADPCTVLEFQASIDHHRIARIRRIRQQHG